MEQIELAIGDGLKCLEFPVQIQLFQLDSFFLISDKSFKCLKFSVQPNVDHIIAIYGFIKKSDKNIHFINLWTGVKISINFCWTQKIKSRAMGEKCIAQFAKTSLYIASIDLDGSVMHSKRGLLGVEWPSSAHKLSFFSISASPL